MKTLLKGALCFTGTDFESEDILICDGIIAAVGNDLQAEDAEIIDFTDKYIFPGFTDVHVHLREPGFSYKENIETGTRAAAAGGYTAVCAMPNLNPVPDCREHLNAELEAIRNSAVVRVYPYGSLSVDEKGGRLSDIEGIADEVIAYSDDGHGLADDELIMQAMLEIAGTDRLIAAHCEDLSVIGGSAVREGIISQMLGINGIRPESEWKMVERDIMLAEATNCAYHVCHVSTAQSVELIRAAKSRGVNVTAETAPHYLLLEEQDVTAAIEEMCSKESHSSSEEYKAAVLKAAACLGRFKMNPPIGSHEDRLALIEAIKDGTIDMIATDHAPHSAEEKARGLIDGPMGITGLECAFPVLYTGLVRTGEITLEKLIELMSIAPGRRFKLPYGIKSGGPANLCVYDLKERYTVDPSNFLSMGKSTPFAGREVYGKCLMTFCEGRKVYDANKK